MTTALPFPTLPKGAVIGSEEYLKQKAFLVGVKNRGKPLAQIDVWAWQMSSVHLILFELLERAYAFAPYAEANNDLESYLGFAEIALYHVCEHHEGEGEADEEVLYPRMKEYSGLDIWEVNVEEHKWFEDQLTAAWIWVRRCRENLNPTMASPIPEPKAETKEHLQRFPELAQLQKFDAKAFQAHIDAFIGTLMTHMCHEIHTLDRVYLEKIGEQNLKRILTEFQQHTRKHDPKWYLCAFIASCDMSTLNSMLPLPWFVKYLLVPLVFGPKFRGWWKYASHPELLTFTGLVGAEMAGEGKYEVDTRAKQD